MMRLQPATAVEEQERPNESSSGNSSCQKTEDFKCEHGEDVEEYDDDGDENMAVDLQLPRGRYSFKQHDFERYLRLQQVLQNHKQSQALPEQDVQHQLQIQGILKKESAYSNSDDEDVSRFVPWRSSRRWPELSSSSFISRSDMSHSDNKAAASSILKFLSSLSRWVSTSFSNIEETKGECRGSTMLLSPTETARVSNKAEFRSSLRSSHLLDTKNENQDLTEQINDLQIQLCRKQKDLKKIKKSRRMDDKRLVKLAKQLQLVDVDHLNVQQSIQALEFTNKELELSLADYNGSRTRRSASWDCDYTNLDEQTQRQKLTTMVYEYGQLIPRHHLEVDNLRRKNKETIFNLRNQLLHETLELQRLVHLSSSHDNDSRFDQTTFVSATVDVE